MFSVQSRYESQVRYLISGDFNKVNIDDILESNGALHQVCTVATRKSTTLELVITDMATMFHPPTTREPLKQDNNSKGKPSDHGVVIVAPKTDITFKLERHKKKVHVRPLPDSKVAKFMNELGAHTWQEVFNCDDAHKKAENFHKTLLHYLNKNLKEKIVNMTTLDKTWFSPSLKLMYNEMQKEFYKNGKSQSWKKLRTRFRQSKRKASKTFYNDFVNDMKVSKPGQYFRMAKRIGAIDQRNQGDLKIECIENLNPQQQVEEVAKSFAKVSCEYNPVNLCELPAYLPANKAPQLQVYEVFQKIKKQKKTKSTL
jgi:hypothetical protein